MSEQGTRGKQTLIEEGTDFKGSFSSDCPIIVKGKISGDISGPSLTVSSTGAVAGSVKVKEMRSEGEISGEYEADIVQLSGKIKDKTVIRAKSLEVKLASETGRVEVVFGECELAVGDMPSKEEAVEAAVSAGSISEAMTKAVESIPPRAAEASTSNAPSAPPADGESAQTSAHDEDTNEHVAPERGNRNKGRNKERRGSIPPTA